MIGFIAIGIIIYIPLQVIFLPALPASPIRQTGPTSAFSTTSLSGPFAQVATLVSLGWLATAPGT